jgi:RimJ/RimL family protein N-acetyltransferase
MATALNFPAAAPKLHSEGLLLRELTHDDIPAWFARATDAASADMAGDPIPTSIEAGTAWLQRQRDRLARQAGMPWAVARGAGGQCRQHGPQHRGGRPAGC